MASRGLRGSVLETHINFTIEQLRKNHLAIIQKIPTPITPIKLDGHGHITLAFFEQKSTVDYIGAVQGIPLCFDAKECNSDTFPLKNIHEHQMEFMKDYREQGGIAFFLLYYTKKNCHYFLTYDQAAFFWKRMKDGGRKSFRFEELNNQYFLQEKNGMICFLDAINIYLQELEEKCG